MNDIEQELLKIEEEFNIYKKNIEKIHITFNIVFFSIITLIIFLLQKYLPIQYNNFYIKIILFSLMILGLMVHFFLRYKYFNSKICYLHFFKNRLEDLKNKFSKKKDFNKLIISAIKNIIKNKDLKIQTNNQNKLYFWRILVKFLNINPDEIF